MCGVVMLCVRCERGGERRFRGRRRDARATSVWTRDSDSLVCVCLFINVFMNS